MQYATGSLIYHLGSNNFTHVQALVKQVKRASQLASVISLNEDKFLPSPDKISLQLYCFLSRCVRNLSEYSASVIVKGSDVECPPYMSKEHHEWKIGDELWFYEYSMKCIDQIMKTGTIF